MSLSKVSKYKIPPELIDVIPGYMTRRAQDFLVLKIALAENDFEAIGKIAHKLKGNGASYGFDRLTEIGIDLLAAAHESNATKSGKIIMEMQMEIENIKASLSKQ